MHPDYLALIGGPEWLVCWAIGWRQAVQFGRVAVLPLPLTGLALDSSSDVPIYRQLAQSIANRIQGGQMRRGERLPATRELAGQLGLNRTTIASAYGVLEQAGMIAGHVGRGSFVSFGDGTAGENIPIESRAINFASSRPAAEAFPLGSFRKFSKAVIDSPEITEILQLGSPQGYGPLRRYLLEADRAQGIARPGNDVVITNGCQQALDLIARIYASHQPGSEAPAVLVEDPVYHGLLRILSAWAPSSFRLPVGADGLDTAALASTDAAIPSTIVVADAGVSKSHRLQRSRWSSGGTCAAASKRRFLDGRERHLYATALYRRARFRPLKSLARAGRCLLLGSYSKVSFPGLRVGWVIGPARGGCLPG